MDRETFLDCVLITFHRVLIGQSWLFYIDKLENRTKGAVEFSFHPSIKFIIKYTSFSHEDNENRLSFLQKSTEFFFGTSFRLYRCVVATGSVFT